MKIISKASERIQNRERKIYEHFLSIIDRSESAQAAYEQIQKVNNADKKNKEIKATSTIRRIIRRQEQKELQQQTVYHENAISN